MPRPLGSIPEGATTLIDANILLYAAAGRSPQCEDFVRRCADGEVNGVITTIVLGELCHRWMMEEARGRGFIKGSNPARQLAASPKQVMRLNDYPDLVRALIHGNVGIETVEREDFISALDIQRRYGLLTNDSLLVAVGQRTGIRSIATADKQFGSLSGWGVYRPSDIE